MTDCLMVIGESHNASGHRAETAQVTFISVKNRNAVSAPVHRFVISLAKWDLMKIFFGTPGTYKAMQKSDFCLL
jgi:hypothetical protein